MADFGWGYPPGAANDPRAPWNARDEHFVPCEFCAALGTVLSEDWDFEQCDECRGTGGEEIECGRHCEICGCRCRECDPDGYNDRRNDW